MGMHDWLVILAILAIQVVVWVPILIWSRRRMRGNVDALRETIADLGERVLLEPEAALYATARQGALGVRRGTAVVALTDRHLLAQPLLGAAMQIALGAITEVSTGKWFHGSYRNGRTHVILKLDDGRDIAVAPADPQRWVAALSSRAR